MVLYAFGANSQLNFELPDIFQSMINRRLMHSIDCCHMPSIAEPVNVVILSPVALRCQSRNAWGVKSCSGGSYRWAR